MLFQLTTSYNNALLDILSDEGIGIRRIEMAKPDVEKLMMTCVRWLDEENASVSAVGVLRDVSNLGKGFE